MRPKVIRSVEDATGDRCVDLLLWPDGTWSWVECRRDPEDAHGWRHLVPPEPMGFPDAAAALTAAGRSVPWLEAR